MEGFHIFSSLWGILKGFSLKTQLSGGSLGTDNSRGLITLILAAAEWSNQFASENHLRQPIETGICVITI